MPDTLRSEPFSLSFLIFGHTFRQSCVKIKKKYLIFSVLFQLNTDCWRVFCQKKSKKIFFLNIYDDKKDNPVLIIYTIINPSTAVKHFFCPLKIGQRPSSIILSKTSLKPFYCTCLLTCICVYLRVHLLKFNSTHKEIRGQAAGDSTLPLPCRFSESNSNRQT